MYLIEFYEWNTGEWLKFDEHSLFKKGINGQWEPLRKLTIEDKAQLRPLFTKIYLDKIS